jgi:hypothetical protein
MEIRSLVQAAESIDDYGNVNQQLSEALNTTPEDINNRKKRLKRRLDRNAVRKIEISGVEEES